MPIEDTLRTRTGITAYISRLLNSEIQKVPDTYYLSADVMRDYDQGGVNTNRVNTDHQY